MSGLIRVSVVYAPAPRQVHEVQLELPAGSTVRDAIEASGLRACCPEIEPSGDGLGIWGRAVAPDQRLRADDRVEIWRPLRVDPKHARRERFDAQGARAAGLFARRRPGSKPGY